jgi:hypothetical protein
MLWQNTSTGERSMWLMNGTTYSSAVILPQVPTAWSIAGSGDFNGDANADILWQNTSTGERSIWFMSGNTYASAALLPQVPTAWSIAGVGDFNSDGNPDIVWQNTVTGERSIWFMNGATYSSAALLPQVPTVWSIAGVGDFNGDGKPDLVWQNTTTGERSIWFMNGSTYGSAAILPTVPTVWRIAAAADFDGDGQTDLVWQNTNTGERSIWLMNGSSYASAVILPTVPVQWSIAGVMSLGRSSCTSASALQLPLGGIHALTAAEKTSLCVGAGASASEYALIPFNNTNVAASTIQVEVTATNTSAIQAAFALVQPSFTRVSGVDTRPTTQSFEPAFRDRERRDLASVFGSLRQVSAGARRNILVPSYLTGIPANPVVGSVVQINANLTGNTCSDPKQLHGALVVAVLPNTIVLSDTQSPTGGYTNAEMTAFGQSFDTLGYALDIANFGAPTDIDANGRVAILFTPGVNVIPAPPGAFVGGLFATRDLFPVSSCAASNEGEMFYMPVPDPNRTINGNYANKTTIANIVLATLVHEFQHLINAGRRIYVNNASSFEEVWLNEGLSHIAEELLYYRISGNAPRSNINLSLVESTQPQVDAFNTYALGDFNRLRTYLASPEINSPFSQVDGLQMRGAIWQLLRYSADRKGGVEANTWSALVNSTTAGQTNFNAVFGDIITNSRDWAVAQFADDAGLNVSANYTNPSWNFRSIMPALNTGGTYPLLTHALLGTPVDITLNGGGAAYLRFGVGANVTANIRGNSAGQPVPSAVDFILLRTH